MGKRVPDNFKLEAVKRNPVIRLRGIKDGEIHPPEGYSIVHKNNVDYISLGDWEPRHVEVGPTQPITEHQKTYYKVANSPLDFTDVLNKLEKKTIELPEEEVEKLVAEDLEIKDPAVIARALKEEKEHDLEEGGIELSEDSLDINTVLGSEVLPATKKEDEVAVEDISDLLGADIDSMVSDEEEEEEVEETPVKKPAKKSTKKSNKSKGKSKGKK